MKSLAQITLYAPGKPAANLALKIEHSSVYNGLQTAIAMICQRLEVKRELINPGYQSANLELGDDRTMFIKMEDLDDYV